MRSLEQGKQEESFCNKRGFTLMELLIVVAIIAVLVAIAIPIFSSQLEKSREATDLANVRSAYAEVMTAVMTDDATAQHNGTPIKQSNGSFLIVVDLKQQQDDWQTDKESLNIAGITPSDTQHWKNTPSANGKCSILYDPATGETIIDWSGNATIYDLSTPEGQLAADNALANEAVRLALEQPITQMTPRATGNIGSINNNTSLQGLSDNWYMWYYDAADGRLLYDGRDYDGTEFGSVRKHLDDNLYGNAQGHRNQAIAVALSEDGQTMLVGWTYHKINNVYVNWHEVDPNQPISLP